MSDTFQESRRSRSDAPRPAAFLLRLPHILTASIGMAVCSAVAAPVTVAVPNGSFERPDVFFVGTEMESWREFDKPPDFQEGGGFTWGQLTGIFENTAPTSSDTIVNCDGVQVGYLFAVPGVGIRQEADTVDFNLRFEPGRSYTVTAGFIGMGGNMLPGVPVELSLYFRDAEGRPTTVAAVTVTNGVEVFPDRNHLVDFTARTAVVRAEDLWAGRPVGIAIASKVGTDRQGGYWDVDHVRLSYEEADVRSVTLAIRPAGEGFRMEWASQPGVRYRVQRSENLGVWTDSGGPLAGDGGALSIDLATTGDGAFFRVVAEPAP